MNITKHKIHQYMKVKGKNSIIYRCMIPGCSHWKRDIFIVNSIAKCWYCGEDFVVTGELARNKRVHCRSCTKSKKEEIKPEEVNEFLTELKE